jgi:hypothetical protein
VYRPLSEQASNTKELVFGVAPAIVHQYVLEPQISYYALETCNQCEDVLWTALTHNGVTIHVDQKTSTQVSTYFHCATIPKWNEQLRALLS